MNVLDIRSRWSGLLSPLWSAHATVGPPSVRVRLLLFLLLPSLVIMLCGGVGVYFVALRYSNSIHDDDLELSAFAMSRILQDEHSDGHINRETIRLISFNPGGKTYYAIRSLRHGLISGSDAPALEGTTATMSKPVLSDGAIGDIPVRVATLAIASPADSMDRLTVSVAETLENRKLRATEILMMTIPIQIALIVILFSLVWQGVKYGLGSMQPAVRRLARRERSLSPISGPDIPVEIQPLTATIDALFERVRELVEAQDRFVADAAHQLRTPLAGLSLQVERALATRKQDEIRDALSQIGRLTARVTRSATQLLALARLQVPDRLTADLAVLDLSTWLPGVVSTRIPDALQAGVDLGYERLVDAAPASERRPYGAARTPARVVAADEALLQELFDNLIDNAFAHAGRGGIVTVALDDARDTGSRLIIDDNGSGVPDYLLPRLGDRFFRAPDAPEGGSGLGLAIVRRIADVHRASLRFGRSPLGGLRVELRFADAVIERRESGAASIARSAAAPT